MTAIKEIQSFFQYAWRSYAILSNMFKDPITLEDAVNQLKDRISNRNGNFLKTMRRAVFDYPDSPYLKLIKGAGLDYAKIESLVLQKGIEECLKVIKKCGVYIDIHEFKGIKETVRGKDVYRFTEKDFNNPLLNIGFSTQSGGSRSAGSNMIVPIEFIQQNNIYGVIASYEYKIFNKPAIIYLPILPAGEGLFFNMRFTAMGNPPLKWFSQIDERYINPSVLNKLKTNSTIWMAKLYGKKMPKPEFVDIKEPIKIVRWMNNNLNNIKGFSVVTYASSALRIVIEAKKHDLTLGETVFLLMGEPLTKKIMEEIEDFGCKAYSLYGCNELMIIGHGCANPQRPDDMHFLKDKLAVIQDERYVAHSDIKVNSFYFTTLLDTSPKIFLNTETGDYGIVEKLKCNCGFENMGLDIHIHSVKSFEKLTAEGATFLGNDLINLIQDVLPREFGGCASDYQFIEEQDGSGFNKLYLLASPELGTIDEERIKRITIATLMGNSDIHSYSRIYWDRSETLKIKRMDPIPTPRGKILPLHIRPSWK